mmetsp:Transcript_23139/g.39313  ORF Transcript_23139/g.39313 Transcript_23139/m.39313 type:complete len:132 (-) Transcript_23139:49-444(-)
MAGSRRYMAPDIILGNWYDKSVDVFSFGLLMWEICAIERPFDGMGRLEHLRRVIHGDERPKLYSWWPRRLQDLMRRCWSKCYRVRPSMREILATLTDLLEAYEGSCDDSSKSMIAQPSNEKGQKRPVVACE